MVDSRAQGEGGEGVRMHDHPVPPCRPSTPPSLSRARKDARGMLGPRWSSRIHIPTATSRVQGLLRQWGTVRGMLEGWGGYIRPARGGESSVRPTGAYRLRRIEHVVFAHGHPAIEERILRSRNAHTPSPPLATRHSEGNMKRERVGRQNQRSLFRGRERSTKLRANGNEA